MPGICKTALAGIAELRADHGIEATPDEVVRLHEAGKRVEDPIHGARLALLGCPVRCGSTTLFRLTIAGEIWWRNLASIWWAGSSTWLTASLGFAMAHGRQSGYLQELCDRDAADAAVKSWFGALSVTPRELDAAIRECLQEDEDDRQEELLDACHHLMSIAGNQLPGLRAALAPVLEAPRPDRPRPVDWEEMAHDLASMTSAPPDYWLHQGRESVLRAWVRATRHEIVRSGKPVAISDSDCQADAIKAFRLEIVAIIAAHKTPEPGATP